MGAAANEAAILPLPGGNAPLPLGGPTPQPPAGAAPMAPPPGILPMTQGAGAPPMGQMPGQPPASPMQPFWAVRQQPDGSSYNYIPTPQGDIILDVHQAPKIPKALQPPTGQGPQQ